MKKHFYKLLSVVTSMMISFNAVNCLAATQRMAVIKSVSGSVKIKKSGGEKKLKATKGMNLSQGDTIITEADGKVTITIDDNKQIDLASNTTITIAKLTGEKGNEKTTIAQPKGQSVTNVNEKLTGQSSYEQKMPTAIMGVKGTIWGSKSDGIGDEISLFNGNVEVIKDEQTILLNPNENIKTTGNKQEKIEKGEINWENIPQFTLQTLNENQDRLADNVKKSFNQYIQENPERLTKEEKQPEKPINGKKAFELTNTSESSSSSSESPTSSPVSTPSEAPATPSEAPATPSEAPATTSEAPIAESEAPATPSEAPIAESKAPTTSEAPAATSEAPAATSEAPVAESKAPTTSEAPVAESKAPTTSEAPAATSEAPVAESKAPTTSEAPAATSEPPTTSEAPAATSEPPTTSEAPAATSEVPTTSEAPAATSEPPTTTESSARAVQSPFALPRQQMPFSMPYNDLDNGQFGEMILRLKKQLRNGQIVGLDKLRFEWKNNTQIEGKRK